MSSRLIIRVEEIARYVVGCLGVEFMSIFEYEVEFEKNPCPDIISNHPWSIFFIY